MSSQSQSQSESEGTLAPAPAPSSITVSGEYVQCSRLKAMLSLEACTLNRKGKGRLKPKELCKGCLDSPKPVDMNQVLAEHPPVAVPKRARLAKAYLYPHELAPAIKIGSMGAAAALLDTLAR